MEKLRDIFENKRVMLLLIILLALILRIIRALEMNRYDVDCYIYFNMAINWAKYGAEYAYQYSTDYCPPLLPWLMSLGYKLGIPPEATGTVLGILLGSLIPVCMFYIVNILFKRPDLALLAAFLGAIHPSLVRVSVRCLRDSLYIPLVAMALVCAVSAIKNKSILKWCLFSIVAALASSARYEGVELILIFLLWFICEIVINIRILRENLKYYFFSLFMGIFIFATITFLVSYLLRDTNYRDDTFYSLITQGVGKA